MKHLCLAAAFACALSVTAGARAADTTGAQAAYEKQRADCLSGKSSQDKATCLKEATNALADAKRGQLGDAGADYRKDQTERCKSLSGDEQRDCLARMKGGGTVSGSVAGGGILREKTTKEVVRPAQTVPAASAASAGG